MLPYIAYMDPMGKGETMDVGNQHQWRLLIFHQILRQLVLSNWPSVGPENGQHRAHQGETSFLVPRQWPAKYPVVCFCGFHVLAS